jgi:hypothetical protein
VYGRIKNEIKIENRTSYRKQRDQIALNFHQAEETSAQQKFQSNLNSKNASKKRKHRKIKFITNKEKIRFF